MSELVRTVLGRRAEARDVHLRACLDRADDVADLADADVLFFERIVDACDVSGQLATYPGCAVCAGRTQAGTVLLAVRTGCGGERIELLASVVHALLAAGFAEAGTARAGEAQSTVVG